MKSYTADNWFGLAKDLYELIITEIQNVSDEHLPEVYPKLIVMYEFFRLIRGEAFHFARPNGIGKFQQEIYRMEDDIRDKLKPLEKKLATKMPNDEDRISYHLDLMKKSFSLKYFNH